MRRILAFTFMITSVFSTSSLAAVIYDNSIDNFNVVYYSGTYPGAGDNHSADDFIFQTSQTVTDVHWYGLYYDGSVQNTDNFTISIFSDNGSGVPTDLGTELYTENIGTVDRVDLGINDGWGLHLYEYNAFIDPFFAQAGQRYWLDIFNPSNMYLWGWLGDSGVGNSAQTLYGTSWQTGNYSTQLGFQLTNDAAPVPEPSTFILLGAGLAGLVAWRRKRS